MKVVVLGGVAAGTKVAAKLKREDRNNEVIIYTKEKEISYAGCGLPYYIGGAIESRESLVVNTPKKYSSLTGVEVKTEMEAVSVDKDKKTVSFKNGETVSYDNLVIATGASPIKPPVEGVEKEGVFTLRSVDDAVGMRAYVDDNGVHKAVVVGASFIGLEVAENLKAKGVDVTVVDMASQILPGLFDPDMAQYAKKEIQKTGVKIMLGAKLEAIYGGVKAEGIKTSVGNIAGEMVVLALGVKPNTAFVSELGLEMEKGAIVVDDKMRTNLDSIYAAGDCALVKNMVTGKRQYSAMGSTANITGRILAKAMSGEDASYKGCLGTAVIRATSSLNMGRTGLTMDAAGKEGYDAECVSIVVDDKPGYYPGSGNFVIKLVADKKDMKLLGVQVAGKGNVDKIVDSVVVGLIMGAKLTDFDSADFSYAPPFSTALNPLQVASYVLENKINGVLDSFTPYEYMTGKAKGYTVVDVNNTPTIPGAKFASFDNLEEVFKNTPKDAKLLLVCARGRKSYLVQNRMKAMGFTNTKSLEGGVNLNDVKVKFEGAIPPEEVKRVKGLGCLQDKRYPDVFNVRIITRNGKISAEEQKTIAEAAEKYGSGEVTMTTRLTLEIQGVKYENLQPLMEFVNEHGLTTGGTGSKVRPVVSCKGTTCQYGLCDTFGLSEKLHELFYVGYHDVVLPHKFKIAVGGCPNNCVKPNLNDLGIVGQNVPVFDYSKCKGCKVCQVEKGCPIKIAKVEDGKLYVDPNECNNCSRCRGKCPFGVTEEYIPGFKVFIGGRWGKKIAHGLPLTRILLSEEEVIDVVEKAILLFRDEGITGERFADTVERLGFDYVNDKLLNSSFDKKAVLEKNVTGGATC
ncbi:MAG: FAD-dependent oxidoreductase [Spirochaetales bacterium]|nr:FAD-dependent oxidoreductase [Spirochaetales bacterium]